MKKTIKIQKTSKTNICKMQKYNIARIIQVSHLFFLWNLHIKKVENMVFLRKKKKVVNPPDNI